MRGFLRSRQALRLDGWQRIEIAAAAVLAIYIAFLLVADAHGIWMLGTDGLPVPHDFNAFWSAGTVAMQGDAASAYDWTVLRAALERHYPRIFDDQYPFFYPPAYLLVVAPLGALSYGWAAAVWIAATLFAYAGAAYAIWPKRVALAVALTAPAAFLTIWVGQNGMLSAALLGGGLALIDRRPLVAGVLIGLLAYKPQFGILIPFVLVAGARWKTIASAALTVAAVAVLAGLVFGWSTYAAFFAGSTANGGQILGAGGIGWFKVQSVYGAARTLGLGGVAAWTLHGAVALAGAAATIALWRSDARFALKAAALPAAALLASPYIGIYDFPIATVAALFLLRDAHAHPLRPAEKATLALAVVLPAAYPLLAIPLGPLVCLALGLTIAQRLRTGTARDARLAAA